MSWSRSTRYVAALRRRAPSSGCWPCSGSSRACATAALRRSTTARRLLLVGEVLGVLPRGRRGGEAQRPRGEPRRRPRVDRGLRRRSGLAMVLTVGRLSLRALLRGRLDAELERRQRRGGPRGRLAHVATGLLASRAVAGHSARELGLGAAFFALAMVAHGGWSPSSARSPPTTTPSRSRARTSPRRSELRRAHGEPWRCSSPAPRGRLRGLDPVAPGLRGVSAWCLALYPVRQLVVQGCSSGTARACGAAPSTRPSAPTATSASPPSRPRLPRRRAGHRGRRVRRDDEPSPRASPRERSSRTRGSTAARASPTRRWCSTPRGGRPSSAPPSASPGSTTSSAQVALDAPALLEDFFALTPPSARCSWPRSRSGTASPARTSSSPTTASRWPSSTATRPRASPRPRSSAAHRRGGARRPQRGPARALRGDGRGPHPRHRGRRPAARGHRVPDRVHRGPLAGAALPPVVPRGGLGGGAGLALQPRARRRGPGDALRPPAGAPRAALQDRLVGRARVGVARRDIPDAAPLVEPAARRAGRLRRRAHRRAQPLRRGAAAEQAGHGLHVGARAPLLARVAAGHRAPRPLTPRGSSRCTPSSSARSATRGCSRATTAPRATRW
jgi:hypothetical protein